MPYKDLREYLEFLSQKGELKVCRKEVDTKVEIAKVTDKSSKVNGPAILFNNVKGFKTSVVTGIFGTVDRTFLSIESTKHDGFKKLVMGLEKPIPHKVVNDGPCKEVIKTGANVDLYQIPALWHHTKENYYYITATSVRVRDPDTGVGNNSINRLAVQSKNSTTIHTNPPQHLRIILSKHLERGKTCPIAIAVGTNPAIVACSGCRIPFGKDELDFAGGVIGEPVEVVKCETSDLEVPATAELVIEGEIRPGSEMGYVGKSDYAYEAPFAEITGHFGERTRSPVIHVNAITHRKDYIYQGLGTAFPPSEHQILNTIHMQYDMYSAARAVVPGQDIRAINPMVSTGGFAAIISMKKRFPGQAKQLIYNLLSHGSLKKVIIVDEDIDVFNPMEVEWAVSFRASPEDYIITAEVPGIPLDPMITTPPNLLRKIGIDATLPLAGDKKGRTEILRDLGPARYPDLAEVDLSDYLKK